MQSVSGIAVQFGHAELGFPTNHARTLLCIAHDSGARVRDIAVEVGMTERSAPGIVPDLGATPGGRDHTPG